MSLLRSWPRTDGRRGHVQHVPSTSTWVALNATVLIWTNSPDPAVFFFSNFHLLSFFWFGARISIEPAIFGWRCAEKSSTAADCLWEQWQQAETLVDPCASSVFVHPHAGTERTCSVGCRSDWQECDGSQQDWLLLLAQDRTIFLIGAIWTKIHKHWRSGAKERDNPFRRILEHNF